MSHEEPVQVLPRYVEPVAEPPAQPVAQPVAQPTQSFMDTMYDYRITILVVALVIVAIMLLAWWIRNKSDEDPGAAATQPQTPTATPPTATPPSTTQSATVTPPAAPVTTQPPVAPVTPPVTPAAPAPASTKLTREELLAKQAKGRAAAELTAKVPIVSDQSLSQLHAPAEQIEEPLSSPAADNVTGAGNDQQSDQQLDPQLDQQYDYDQFYEYLENNNQPAAEEQVEAPAAAEQPGTCIQVLGSGATCRNKPKFGQYCGVHAKK